MSRELLGPYRRGFYFCSASCVCPECLGIDAWLKYHPTFERPLFEGRRDTTKIPAPRDFPPDGVERESDD